MIKELLKRPIAYNPIVAKAFGSVKLGILWSQMYYWSDKTKDEAGWIYKTQNEVFEETGLSRKEQETARKLGNKLGVLESMVMGVPPKVNFRVDIDKTIKTIEVYMKKKGKKKTKGIILNQDNTAKVIGKVKRDIKGIKPGIFNRKFFDEMKVILSNPGVQPTYQADSSVFDIKWWIAEKKIIITMKDMSDFVLYWTEPTKSGKKERWETERTFDVKRRLLKWIENKNKWSKPIGNKKSLTV